MELISPVLTTTVAFAVAVPAFPVAVAVKLVVFPGFTVTAPPLPGRVKVLPSEPATVICVELSAVTVKVDVAPPATTTGLALTATSGAIERLLPLKSAHPLIRRGRHSAAEAGCNTRPCGREARPVIEEILLCVHPRQALASSTHRESPPQVLGNMSHQRCGTAKG